MTDRVSTGGNAIASVRLSVCLSVSTLTFQPRDFWPLSFACVWVMTITFLGLKVKVCGQGQTCKVKVKVECSWSKLYRPSSTVYCDETKISLNSTTAVSSWLPRSKCDEDVRVGRVTRMLRGYYDEVTRKLLPLNFVYTGSSVADIWSAKISKFQIRFWSLPVIVTAHRRLCTRLISTGKMWLPTWIWVFFYSDLIMWNLCRVISYYLARLAHLPKGLYILPSVISFFFKLSKAISVPTGPIFTIFSPNGRYLRDVVNPGQFFDSSRDVANATNFGQNWQNDLHSVPW